jgi:acyl-CoA thioesterase FadM
MNESSETVVSHLPFTVRRVARWTDCDPAGVVYTGKFTDYLLGAVMHFLRHIGYGPGAQRHDQRVGLPGKHLSLTFHASLYPEDAVDIRISVAAIRRRTFDIVAKAYFADGRLAFEGQFTPIAIHPDKRESVEIPDALLHALSRHLDKAE